MTVVSGGRIRAADEGGGAGPGPGSTVLLNYEETEFPTTQWTVLLGETSVAFRKEPDFGSHRVTRHQLKFGNAAGASISLAWDRTAQKLYADLNRNGDLTDETNGVFTADQRGSVVFRGLRLLFGDGAAAASVLGDLQLWEYSRQTTAQFQVRSFWQGRLRMGDRDWQVGGVPGAPQEDPGLRLEYMVLRPWSQRGEGFSVWASSGAAFQWPQRLFWGGQAFTIAAQFTTGAPGGTWRTSLVPCEAGLAELQLTGQALGRVVLRGGEWTVVMDEPRGSVRVPVGKYPHWSVWLAKDGATAYREREDAGGQLVVGASAPQPAVLAAGGPLTNTVSVTRRGRLLVFDYRLLGANGDAYRLGKEDRSRPPQFAVYHRGKEIASGNFEFG